MLLTPPLWCFSDVNHATLLLFGVGSKAHFTTLSPGDISPERQPDGQYSSEKAQEMIAIALREGNHFFEWEHKRLNGEAFFADVLLTRIEAGGESILQATVRDHGERTAWMLQSAIFNSANFSSIATDAKGVIQIFNVGAERMLGYTAAEVMNKITPADISDPHEVIARAKALSVELETLIAPGFEALVFKASRGIEDIYELTYIRKDGSRFPAVVSVTALRDVQDAIIGYLLIGTDNTARKQAEEALLKAGALQNAIFNSANFSIIATDEQGIIQLFNVGAERMLGYAATDVLNKISPADISDPQEMIMRAKTLSDELSTPISPGFEALVYKASRGIEDVYELTKIRKDGSRFPAVVSVTALRDNHDATIGYLLIGTDNTARKQIESEQRLLGQRLRDQQFYTRSLFESSIDAMITTDPFGIITDVNKQMEMLTGCTRDELIGAPFKNYFTNPERAEASISLVLIQKKVTNYELTARDRDGKETVVSYNATTIYDRDRRLQGVFAAARDITERIRLDHVLQGKNVELEAANKELEDFAYSVSHDLRAPLRAIDGFSRKVVVSYGERLDDEGRRLLQVVRDNAQRMGQLIDNLLAFSRMGRREIVLQPLDMDAMVEGVADELCAAEPQRTIEFAFSPLPHAMGDAAMVRQVWVNLLGNAVKFTRQRPTAHIEVGSRIEGGELLYWVKDDGAGFDMQYADKLFGVFQRLHRQDEFEGVGVGLAIVQRILHRHNGRIWGEGAPDAGATLYFTLPLPTTDNQLSGGQTP
jgi:PAS domain S-box-containing protein